MQDTLFSGWIPLVLGGMNVLSFIEHGSVILAAIFGYMGLWYIEKVRGEEEHMDLGPI